MFLRFTFFDTFFYIRFGQQFIVGNIAVQQDEIGIKRIGRLSVDIRFCAAIGGQLDVRMPQKAKGSERVYTPGEIEWGKHKNAELRGIELPADVEQSLRGLADELHLPLPLMES